MRNPNKNLPPGGKRRGLWALVLLFSAGCVGAPAMLQPVSENAQSVANLTQAILWIALVVFLIVEVLLIVAAVRYRRRPGEGLPKQVHGNMRMEIAWTSFTAVVLLVIFALTLGTLFTLGTPQAQALANDKNQTVHVVVIGHQWWWEFQYPDLGITTANELHVPVGATLLLDLKSVDVIHSFWVPQLGGKLDAIPGLTNQAWYRVKQGGVFRGQCSEFCGKEHALMHIVLYADQPEAFATWVKEQQVPFASSPNTAAGEKLFMTRGCQTCHTIAGTKAQGKVGPDMTHFGSRATFAGAAFTKTPDEVMKWLKDPQAMKPGNYMPNLGLTQDEITELMGFLSTLK